MSANDSPCSAPPSARPESSDRNDAPPSSRSIVWTTNSASARSLAAWWTVIRAGSPAPAGGQRPPRDQDEGAIAWSAPATIAGLER